MKLTILINRNFWYALMSTFIVSCNTNSTYQYMKSQYTGRQTSYETQSQYTNTELSSANMSEQPEEKRFKKVCFSFLVVLLIASITINILEAVWIAEKKDRVDQCNSLKELINKNGLKYNCNSDTCTISPQ